MLTLKTEADLVALHTGNIRESLHLEYKSSAAIDKSNDKTKLEMARDVSAFANADGGQIIYGMTEVDHDPAGLDAGLDPKTYPEIWFEQIIQQHVTPTIEGLRPYHVPLASGRVAVVFDIPATKGDPHQADGRYYRRHNFNRLIMEHYEVSAAFKRMTTPLLEVTPRFWGTGSPTEARMERSAEASPSSPIRLDFLVANKANQPAQYAVLMVYLDINLKFGNSEMFNPGSVDIIEDHVYLSLAANLGFPASSPLFKENPESAGSVEFIVNQPKGAITKFALLIDILTPGYSKRTRWFLRQIDTQLSLYEDTNYRPAP